MVTHVSTTYSETGMAQANMDGDVAEPDPMVLMKMIRTVASFRGYVLQRTRAPMHVSMRTQTIGDRVSCFLMFLCALLSVSRSGVNNNVLVLSASNPHPPSSLILGVRVSCNDILSLS